MTRNSLWKLLTIAAILALLIAACGDDDDEDPTSTSPSEGGAPTETRDTGDGGGGGDEGDGDAELIAMGQQLYTEQGCSGCHSVDGSTVVGPSWQGLFGKEETLDDGSTVTVDAAYLAESIREPNAKIVEGFAANLMPPYAFDDDQVAAIVAYIESLSE